MILRTLLRTRIAWAYVAAVVALVAILVYLFVASVDPLRAVGLFMVGAAYGWAVTHVLHRRAELVGLREAIDLPPPGCDCPPCPEEDAP